MAATAATESRDLRLGRLIVKQGLASKQQVEECIHIRHKLAAAGAKRPLADILKEKGYVDDGGAAEVQRLYEKLKAADRAAQAAAAASGAGAGTDVRRSLKIPGFEIIGQIGKGGMGAVFKARQKSLDRIVALKVLSPDIGRDASYVKRFMTEARALARLNHENIIQGIDVGEANGYRYFAMEYVDGESLATLIEREGALPEKRALTIAMQVARALVHADKSGLVHRDVKPQNIMIGRNDVAKLCDLGLAMTAEERREARDRGQSIGTPHYISPEQARGEHHVDIRSDIYSLGATLYHAVTGETPFTGNSPMVLMTKHLTEEPLAPRKRNPKVSKALSDLIVKMMAKDKEKRYQTSIELLDDMERVLAGRSLGAGEAPRGTAAAEGRSGKAKKAGAAAPALRPKHQKLAAAAARRPTSSARDDDEEEVEGDEEEVEEEERPRRPRKQSPAVMVAISFFVLLIAGVVAFVIFTREPPPKVEPPPSAEMEDAAMQSVDIISRAYNKGDIDKYGAMQKFKEVMTTFPRTKGAKEAEQKIKELERAPVRRDVDPGGGAPGEAGEEGGEPALKRAPLGAKEPDDD